MVTVLLDLFGDVLDPGADGRDVHQQHPFHHRTSAAPPQRGGLRRSVPERGEIRRQPQHGDGDTGHVEAGDVVADQAAGDGGALCRRRTAARRRTPRRARSAACCPCRWPRPAQPAAGRRGSPTERSRRSPPRSTPDRARARLAVDAHPELDLAFGQVEAGLPSGRHRARGERDPEGPGPLVDLAGHVGDALELLLLLGESTGDLLHEHGGAGAPASSGVELSCTATSSLTTTGMTSIPSSPASSAAIWKFRTSPV